MTVGECKKKAFAYMNEYSANGVVIPVSNNNQIDYLLRANSIIDNTQKSIAKIFQIFKKLNISQIPLEPTTKGFGFNTIQHLNSDINIFSGYGIKSLYFEVDKPATVYIEEAESNMWQVLETISITDINEFTAYKRKIVATGDNKLIRVRFSGDYPYNIRNVGLWTVAFEKAEDIPTFAPYVRYEMPKDFIELKAITCEMQHGIYTQFGNYEWENTGNVLLIPYYFKGNIIVEYACTPTDILTDEENQSRYDDVVLDLPDIACTPIPLKLGADLLRWENPALSERLNNAYELELSRLSVVPQHESTKRVTDIYGYC